MTNQQNCRNIILSLAVLVIVQTVILCGLKWQYLIPQLFSAVKNGTLCAHINIHSLVSKFDEIKHHV